MMLQRYSTKSICNDLKYVLVLVLIPQFDQKISAQPTIVKTCFHSARKLMSHAQFPTKISF